MNYYLSVLSFSGIYMVAVLGTFLLTGMTGMISLGQGAMMAVGAYATGILTTILKLPVIPSIICALLIAALVSLGIGAITLKLKPDFFGLATFAFGSAIESLLALSTKFTGGASGLIGVPMAVRSSTIWITLLVCIAIIAFLTYSSFGRTCLAIRDDALAADVMGIKVYQHKMKVFVISSMLAALAGCLYVHYTSFIDPSLFGWMKSAEWMILVFVGGRGNLPGTVVSALFLLALPEVLRPINMWRTPIYSVLVLAILNFRPDGIFGIHYTKTSGGSLSERIQKVFKKESGVK